MKRIFSCCRRYDDRAITANEPPPDHLASASTLLVTHTARRRNDNHEEVQQPEEEPPQTIVIGEEDHRVIDTVDTLSTASSSNASLDHSSLLSISKILESGVKVSDRKYRFRTYRNCFVGREAVDFMIRNGLASSRQKAVEIGLALMREFNLMEHVCRQHDFGDDYLFFRFVPKRNRFVSINDEVGCFMHTHGNAIFDYDDDDESSLGGYSDAAFSTVSSISNSQSFQNLNQLAVAFEDGVETRDHRYRFKVYQNVFVGSDAVDHMVVSGMAPSRSRAVELGRALTREHNLFRHVAQDHEFKDDYLFYEFTPQHERFGSSGKSVGKSPDKGSNKMPLQDVAAMFERGMPVRDHMYRLKVYRNTFVGSKAVDFMVKTKMAASRRDAVRLGRKLVHWYNLFEHVFQEHDFQDDYFFYRFVPQERRIVSQEDDEEGSNQLASPDAHSVSSSLTSSTNSNSLQHVANAFRKGVVVRNHHWRLKTYRNTFVASEAVDFLIHSSFAQTRKEAVMLGRTLAAELDLFEHVTGEHMFKDDYLFFRFIKHEKAGNRRESFISDITDETIPLEKIAQEFRANVNVKDHKYHLKTYKNTFVGRAAVDFLVKEGLAETREDAVDLGRRMAKEFNLFEHVMRDHEFKDEFLFYRFVNMGELRHIRQESDVSDIDLDIRELHEISIAFEAGVKVRDNRYHLHVYKNTFVGSEAVDFLIEHEPTRTREEAVQIGLALQETFNLFEHVCGQHDFKDDFLFFRFNPHSERHSYDLDKLTAVEESSLSSETAQETMVSEEEEDELHDVVQDRRLTRGQQSRRQSFRLPGKSISWRGPVTVTTKIKVVDRRASMPVISSTSIQPDTAERVKTWSSTFRRVDPRYQILSAVNTVAQDKAYNLKAGIDRDVISELLRGTERAPLVFSVWRPTSFDAIRKMMLGEGTGKGLDIKGKSAKRGKMSGFVPFLQISENRHKQRVRTLPKDSRVRLFFKDKRAREIASGKLEIVAHEMIATVKEAKKVLSNDRADKDSHQDALKSMLLDVSDPSIVDVDDYAPQCYGMELPVRLFWEAFFVRQDCTRKPGSEFDTGRPSVPAFQDMNFASLRRKSSTKTRNAPRAVVMQQGSAKNAMCPFELVMAYEEHGRVLPVVSDFDCFLVGTRNVQFSAPLPPDQLEVLNWSVGRIEEILDSPLRPNSWTSRWLEVLKSSADKGFQPQIPQLGFGDPMSYSTMEEAVKRLTKAGAVRHGAECFNYYFPQDLDDEYLVISDTIPGNVSWKYVDVNGLQDFLSDRIDEGYTFPLNPKHILCDAGKWKGLYDKLMKSDKPYVQESLNVWYPKDSSLRERIEEIYARHPQGFQRQSVADKAMRRDSWYIPDEKNEVTHTQMSIENASTTLIAAERTALTLRNVAA